MPHEQHRRCIETFHEQPRLLVDRQGEGSASARHAATLQKIFHRAEKGRENVPVVYGADAAEMPPGSPPASLRQGIYLRADRPHIPAVATREPESPPCPAQELVVPR